MCIGNTCGSTFQIPVCSVYPCVYREHHFNSPVVINSGGLSLCIQGTLYLCSPLGWSGRFIPVYTGNTACFSVVAPEKTVYPCVYREHFYNRAANLRQLGLSLCIQGTRKNNNNVIRLARFIPVYTGNTALHRLCLKFRPVYPCVYREHSVFVLIYPP